MKKSARVAIPAHIYISVPITDEMTEEQILRAAIARLEQVGQGEGFDSLRRDFDPDECVMVYVKYTLAGEPDLAGASIDDIEEE